jgi:MFS family permease
MNTDFSKKWSALLGLSLLAFPVYLDFTMVSTALPAIKHSFGVDMLTMQWVSNVFVLMLSMFMIVAGRLGDMYGRSRIFFIAIVMYVVAGIGAGVSPSIFYLIGARALQGLAAAAIFTLGIALIPEAFPRDCQKQAVSFYTAFVGVGLAIGPFLAGLLISLLSWRWIFFVNIPIVIIGFSLCAPHLQKRKAKMPTMTIDKKGLVLLVIGMGALVSGLIQVAVVGIHTFWVPALLVIAVCALGTLVFVELREPHPLLSFSVFKNPWLVLAMLLCVSGGFVAYVLMFFDPFYLSVVKGYRSLDIGLLMLVVPLGQVIISGGFSWLMKYIKIPTLALIAQVVGLAAALMHVAFHGASPLWLLVSALFLLGVVWGVANTGSVVIVNHHAKGDKAGSTVGTVLTMFNVAGSVGLAVTSGLFYNGDHTRGIGAFLSGFHNVMWAFVAVMLCVLLGCFIVGARNQKLKRSE